MELENYFDKLAADDIRLKGTRIGIEHILYQYIHRGQTPEAIAEQFRTVTLEQVYATILYYLNNQEAIAAYLSNCLSRVKDYTSTGKDSFHEEILIQDAVMRNLEVICESI